MRSLYPALFTAGFSLLAAIPLVALTDSEPQAQATVSMEDFRILEGGDWEGSLTYLNYGSDTRSSIPVKLAIEVLNDRSLRFAIRYPGEEEYNNSEKIKISRNGQRIDGYDLIVRERQPDGALVLTTQGRGRDDDREADIRMVYSISPSEFRLEKNVRFDPDDTFFNRNEYRFSR